jgi:hypothetical protein
MTATAAIAIVSASATTPFTVAKARHYSLRNTANNLRKPLSIL